MLASKPSNANGICNKLAAPIRISHFNFGSGYITKTGLVQQNIGLTFTHARRILQKSCPGEQKSARPSGESQASYELKRTLRRIIASNSGLRGIGR
jgi:hypothetical protein